MWPRTTADGEFTNDIWGNTLSLEKRLGRKLDFVIRYYGWTQLPPDGQDENFRDGGRMVVIDLRARNFSTNEYVSWSSIANGDHDAYLAKVATRIKSYGVKVFFSFNQEPEQELERGTDVAGTAAEFAAAYRHLRTVFDRAGATNAVWVWWIMGYTGHAKWYPDLYPGDKYVDWISYDPYDFNSCHSTGNETPTQSLKPFYDWLDNSGLGAGKPVMLSEFGSNGTDRGDWYRGVAGAVKKLPRIKAIAQWNSRAGDCDIRVTTSDNTWNGFAALSRDPYLNQPVRLISAP